MNLESTSATLLERVRDRRDDAAWREFFKLYHPLILRYACGRGLGRVEAEEIAQACMETLSEKMPRFRYSRAQGRFKNYPRTAVDNHIKNARRARRPVSASATELERLPSKNWTDDWERVWLRQHLLHCLERMGTQASDHTVRAFCLYCLEGWPVERVSAKLNLTANQVYLAKTRMIRRLRAAASMLIGEGSI